MTFNFTRSATDCAWETHRVCLSHLLRSRLVILLFVLLVFLGLVHVIGRFSVIEIHHVHEFVEIIVLSSDGQHVKFREKFSKAACLTNNGCCFTIKFQQMLQVSLVHLAHNPLVCKLAIPISIRRRG